MIFTSFAHGGRRHAGGTRPIAAATVASVLAAGIALPMASAIAAPNERTAVVRTLANRVGTTVGAASSCQSISRMRVQTVIDKFSAVIKEATSDEAERAGIMQQLNRSVSTGRSAAADCSVTERQFADLEQSIGVSSGPATTAAAPPPSIAPVAQTAAIPSPVAGAVRGVSDREIRFGMAGPFSGASKELGRQMKLGIDTAFAKANDAGGVAGRALRLVAVDDGYEPTKTPAAMAQLYDKEQVMGIIGNVGTPTAEAALPFALQRKMLFFGAFTGAQILRNDPPDRYVFNYRAGYAEETAAVVHYLVKVRRLQPRQIAVLVQQDSYGEAGYAGVLKAMRALGAGDNVALRMTYKRNTADVAEAITQLRTHKGSTIRAVVMVASYRAAEKFIEKGHEINPNLIYTNVSFVGSTALADELKLLGPQFTKGVIVTQVVPAVDGYSSAILEYKTALSKYAPGEAPDYVSLEGYISANILIQGLKQAGPQLDTERLVESLENLRGLDMGLGTQLNFGRSDHQATRKVWGTMLNEAGTYQSIDLE